MRIVCVLKSGGDYHPHHVHALQVMCGRWAVEEHEFWCLTDVPELLTCKTATLQGDAKGWWAKIELFRAFQGPTLFFDLDTVIRGPFSIKVFEDAPFVILRDFYRGENNKRAMGSGMMYWSGDLRWVWEMWQQRGVGSLRGDQDFLEEAFKDRDVTYFQDVDSQMACSFKAGIRDVQTPSCASVVCFHGKPRPWEQSLVPYPAQSIIDNGDSVVVVGNGPSVLRQKLGRVIDSFDEVVRINAFEIAGLFPHTGRVTTMHATHGKNGGRRGAFTCDRTLWLHEHAAWDCRESWLVPKSFYWGLTLPWAADKSILPSAGFVTVAWLLYSGVPIVHLAGFDHFSKVQSGNHHYWETQIKTPPKEHSPTMEAAQFEVWRQQGLVSYL